MSWLSMNREEKVAAIAPLVAGGLSGAEIAAVIGGASRGAVIGFMNRWMKDTRRPASGSEVMKARAARKRARPKTVAPKRTPYIEPVYVPVDPIRFIDRRFAQCAFIPGDPRLGARAPEIMCCGAQTYRGSSWCSHHWKLVYQPEQKRLIQPERRAA